MSTYYATPEGQEFVGSQEGLVHRITCRDGYVWVRWVRRNIAGSTVPMPMGIAPPTTAFPETGRHRAPVSLWRRLRDRWAAICDEGEEMLERDV